MSNQEKEKCDFCEGTGNDWPKGCDYQGSCPACKGTGEKPQDK